MSRDTSLYHAAHTTPKHNTHNLWHVFQNFGVLSGKISCLMHMQYTCQGHVAKAANATVDKKQCQLDLHDSLLIRTLACLPHSAAALLTGCKPLSLRVYIGSLL
jgi:hypothetical protein